MSQATFRSTPSGRVPSFTPNIIDIDSHPDRDLLRLCSCLVRLRGQLEALERAIACIPAATPEGERMKALSL